MPLHKNFTTSMTNIKYFSGPFESHKNDNI